MILLFLLFTSAASAQGTPPDLATEVAEIKTMLAQQFSVVGFSQGLGLGVVTALGWMLFGYTREVFKDRDE
jgi:hypothetical protein